MALSITEVMNSSSKPLVFLHPAKREGAVYEQLPFSEPTGILSSIKLCGDGSPVLPGEQISSFTDSGHSREPCDHNYSLLLLHGIQGQQLLEWDASVQ